jgi:succinoglycan biosynthesis transport protein ExoP
LLLSKPGNEPQSQTLLFTSALPDEGKTTVAVNVARVLARSGLRVAVVDADLHSRASRKFFGDPDGHGLVNFLCGEVEADAILHRSEIPGLTVVPSGTRHADTEGLFLRPRLEELINHLRAQRDFVILDGAPVLSADNSALLIPHADSVVLVTRPFHTRARLIRQALDMLYQRRAKQVTIVLNRARAEDLSGYYAENGVSRAEKNGASAQA